MNLKDPKEKKHYDAILGDDILEPDEVGQVILVDDSAIVRLKERERKIDFFNSNEFKEAEKERIEASKPTEHVYWDEHHERVYCPIEDRIRPSWLCQQEHGDYHEILDVNESEEA